MFPSLRPPRFSTALRSLALSALLCPILAHAQTAKLVPGDYVAICGDSITEQKQYSRMMETYFLACQPVPKLQASQFGWGGETAPDFFKRMDNDVLPFKPNVATLSYGMNDGGYIPTDAKRLANYKEGLINTIKRFKAAGVRQIVVGTAGAVDTTTFKSFFGTPPDVYNRTLTDFGDAAKQIAAEEGVAFADVHGTMADVMAKAKEKNGRDYVLAGKDGIHPDANGHLVMAYSYLKALGCTGNIGMLTLDMFSGQGTASEGHRVLNASNNSLQVESTRYPFCFTGDPAKPDATTGIIDFLPFNQDLNRLVLVVRNAPRGKVKVTWGKSSKEFDGAELAKGINLAAEFLDNPFSEPFKKVWEAVGKQQNYETPMVKTMIHDAAEMIKSTPNKAAAFESLKSSFAQVDSALRDSSAMSVAPVKYEIKVEAVGGQ